MQPNPKKILSGPAAKEKLLAGVKQLYIPVASSLGPRSSNTAIARQYGAPAVVHDGVTIARSCLPLADPEENVGAEIAFEAANKTNGVGDGTTTATVLCYVIASKAHMLITAGAKPMALREGIELATNTVVNELNKLAKPIEDGDESEVLRIATISAQNEGIGKMVAAAYKELGKDGILTVEESRTTSSMLELKQGMEFDRGWKSGYFVAKGSKLGEAIVEKPHILIVDHAIRSTDDFAQMLIRLVDGHEIVNGELQPNPKLPKIKNLVIIADDFSPEVLAFFLKNHLSGTLNGLMVTAPSYGDKRLEMLQDIAILTGGQVITQTTGSGLRSVTAEMLGAAAKVTSTKDTTLIVQGGGSQEDVDARAETLQQQAQNPDLSAFDREKILERLARLRSGVGVLNIGANSEPEMKERKERAIDAISAAKAALQEGIVPGGGMSLILAAAAAQKALEKAELGNDARFGANLVIEACQAPFEKLLSNAGYDPGEYRAKLEGMDGNAGVDVMTGKIVYMIEAGIIDPVMVVTAALANASSAAVMIATSDNVVTEQPIKEAR